MIAKRYFDAIKVGRESSDEVLELGGEIGVEAGNIHFPIDR